jgi:exodeoxyribonuclease VIII
MTQIPYNACITQSKLKVLASSPTEFYERYIARTWPYKPATPAMLLGSMVHCLALEPDEFDNRFAVMPDVDGRTKEGKAVKAEFAARYTGKDVEFVTDDDFVTASLCHAALLQHDEFGKVLANLDKMIVEKEFYWNQNGVDCAGKPDIVDLKRGIIWDIKTTQDVRSSVFGRQASNLAYARQAAFYLDGVHQCTDILCDFIFVAVKTTPVHEVAAYLVPAEAIRDARDDIDNLLTEYKRRVAQNYWKAAHETGICELQLPKWNDWFVCSVDELEEVSE